MSSNHMLLAGCSKSFPPKVSLLVDNVHFDMKVRCSAEIKEKVSYVRKFTWLSTHFSNNRRGENTDLVFGFVVCSLLFVCLLLLFYALSICFSPVSVTSLFPISTCVYMVPFVTCKSRMMANCPQFCSGCAERGLHSIVSLALASEGLCLETWINRKGLEKREDRE